MKQVLFFLFLFFPFFNLQADTIKMMQYNMMYYTASAPSGCNTGGNYLNSKDANLKTIFQYVQPDVLCVNEIGASNTYVNRVLTQVLNTDGINYFDACPLTNFSGGSIANMLFYDKRKLGFHSHFYVTTSVRDINAYKMYYQSAGLQQGDTIFITFIIAHLKAGNTDSDKATRLVQVQRLMTKLEQIGIADNYVFSGDFNLYSDQEQSFQHLINYPNTLFKFYDPIDQIGYWHDNPAYASVHTQSTHTYSENGCFATGGLDDRFDFILVSPYIYFGNNKVKAIKESYHALGQDGIRLNRSLIDPPNTAVPNNIANAMYNFSDHLPVLLDFEINTASSIKEFGKPTIQIQNPVRNSLIIDLLLTNDEVLDFEIYTINGVLVDRFSRTFTAGSERLEYPFPFCPAVYI